jgi:hypothetical protein
MLMQSQPERQYIPPTCCPTCRAQKGFTFMGEQRWPERVAKQLGTASIVMLWRCEACQTTITIEPATH